MKTIAKLKWMDQGRRGRGMTATFVRSLLLAMILTGLLAVPVLAKDERVQPKEFGVYVKTAQGLKRLLPNMVFDEKGVIYVESNNPQRFLLKDVEHFVFYGSYDLDHLTMNPLVFLQQSPVGKIRYIFGRDLPMEVKKTGKDMHTVKPKDLLGRGYFSLWINDSAWDFVIE
jgi:hypothetical protein